ADSGRIGPQSGLLCGRVSGTRQRGSYRRMVGIRAVAGARLHSSGHVSTRATEIPFGVVAARASRDLAAEALVARHPSGCDRTPSPGRLSRRVHLSIQPSYVCLARQTVLSPGPAGCAGRSGPVCNPGQTTAYCVRWREVNTPICPILAIVGFCPVRPTLALRPNITVGLASQPTVTNSLGVSLPQPYTTRGRMRESCLPKSGQPDTTPIPS